MPARVVDPSFLARLEAARVALDLSFDALAAAIGTHATTLHRWRRGETMPSRPAVRRLGELTAVADALTRVYGPRSPTLVAWLDTPQPLFGGEAPRALLVGGRAAFLHAALSLHGRAVHAPPLGPAIGGGDAR